MVRENPAALTVPVSIDWVYSTDFTHNQLSDGRCTQLFNVSGDFNWEALGIEVDFWLTWSE